MKFSRILRTIRRPIRFRAVGPLAGGLISRGDAARGQRQYEAAAALYEEALRLTPNDAAIHVQCGHMLKEAGDLANAERHYLAALRLTPRSADLAMQLGHFYKVADRFDESLKAYRRALDLRPGWSDAQDEWLDMNRRAGSQPEGAGENENAYAEGLVPELFPRRSAGDRTTFTDALRIKRLGARRLRTPWGIATGLRGVEAIHGYVISSVPMTELQVLLDGAVIHATPLAPTPLEGGRGLQRKYVFNLWLDFSAYDHGPHLIELRFARIMWEPRIHRQHVVVMPALSEADFPGSDALISLTPGDTRPPAQQIDARSSMIRPARRAFFAQPVRNVLIQRTDQLGDMVTSIPALRRLRELLPAARLVGLVTSANAEFARTLDIFDEIIDADFPDDPLERRRIMPADAQEALRGRLAPYRFDIAIDLAESAVSRPLLLLSGAAFLYGFYDREWPWLDAGFECSTHDPQNYLESSSQSSKLLAMIERLGTLIHDKAEVIRRRDLSPALLESYGIMPGERYAVLHTGARLVFSRWQSYPELATRLVTQTDLKVLLFADDPRVQERVDPASIASGRIRIVRGQIPFDHFDALLSFCTVFVGNDSGPKHLAALRGAKVVSIHSARINWNEWGQELEGAIISRKVPCAGCAIFHDADECGRDIACIRLITVDEVFETVAGLI